jgi:glycosyltransferase involved in cell wall biosynthesis
VVYVPEDEDFWMIPLEAMSCGVPVIWVNQGGLRETILHQKTWWLLEPNNLEHDIVSLVGTLEREILISMQRSCIERALEFDLRQFEEQVKLSIMR